MKIREVGRRIVVSVPGRRWSQQRRNLDRAADGWFSSKAPQVRVFCSPRTYC